MGTKRANGEGSFRKRSSNSWEGRIVLDDKRRCVYGKTKGEVRQKVAELQNDFSNGTLVDENNITVGEWMDTWAECYTSGVKSSTLDRYLQDIRVHIKPDLGQIQIQDLKLLTVQRFLKRCKDGKGLSEKSLKNIYLVLNKAITRAQKDGLVKKNPCADAEIPMYETPKKEMRALKDDKVPQFLSMISGHPLENLFYTALFTGMRESELLGLTWDCVDLEKGTIHLYRQLKQLRGRKGEYVFTTLKNKQDRSFTIPPSVVRAIKREKVKQSEAKLRYGTLYHNDMNLVFTNDLGRHLCTFTVYNSFKRIVKAMGIPEVRLHDLRHSYATLAIQNGIDYKTISNNLGHATVAFTMDVYATVTMTMQKDSASKMESFIQSL